MKTLQILMPMGGLGSRFSNAGYTTPKPLIPVDGMPMFQKALSSLTLLDIPKKVFFVIRQEHVETQLLDKLIYTALPDAQIIVIPTLTRGAAETALAAKSRLNPEDPLVIMDCDLWFNSESYNKMIVDSISGKLSVGGGLLTFSSDNPRYSYAKVDDDNYVSVTAEKRVISPHAITGAYFYSSAQLFIDATNILMRRPIGEDTPEYYLSLTYNILIHMGKKIKAAYVDSFASFGTPEELKEYESKN